MRGYEQEFSKISDKIPELRREKSYEMYYGQIAPERVKEIIENPKDYLTTHGITGLDDFRIKTEIINHELMFSPILIFICMVIITFPRLRQVEIKMIVHDKNDHEQL